MLGIHSREMDESQCEKERSTIMAGTSRMSTSEILLIWIESLQWCANNAVYFLGLIGAATYDLAGGAFLVAGIALVKNLCMSLGNVLAGPVIDRVGPRRVTLATLGASVAASLVVGILPLSVALLFFAAVTLGGLGTAFGAFVGSMIIGMMVELTNIWLPGDLKFATALLILILILLVRPQGIFGRKERIG